VDFYLPYFRQWLITCPLSALLPFQSLFTESYCGDQLLAPLPFSSELTAPHPLCWVFLFSSFFIVQFFFQGGGQSVQAAMLVYPQGWLGGIPRDTCCSPVDLLDVSQAGLELVFGGVGALLFSQCNVAWRSFVWAGVSGCHSFYSSWCFFFFFQVWLHCLIKIFDLWISCCLLLHSSCHLGSSQVWRSLTKKTTHV
jgi:hypothetical protein